jgi:hypothetical protein
MDGFGWLIRLPFRPSYLVRCDAEARRARPRAIRQAFLLGCEQIERYASTATGRRPRLV